MRGLIAEEFARYTLLQKFPLIVLRPIKVLDYLEERKIRSPHAKFLQKYSHTMDFFGIGPISDSEEMPAIPTGKLIQDYFYRQDGLTKFIAQPSSQNLIKGYIIEVKSRSTKNHWKPFQYSFSSNQERMLSRLKKYNFEVIICGVTFAKDWKMAVVFTNQDGKIISLSNIMQDQ